MPKLHEILAVEKPFKNQAIACMTELIGTFHKKEHHFHRTLKTFKSNTEGVPPETEAQSDIQTSVAAEIKWICDKLVPAIDVSHQVDVMNGKAVADVILDDNTVLLKDIPAISLLQLEKRMAEIMTFIKAIPTLDPAKGFTFDEQSGTYKARDINKPRTKKAEEFIVVVPATEKFPAQVAPRTSDVVTGTIQEQEWCSLITTARKGELLDRCEELARAIKAARSRANSVELDVQTPKIGDVLTKRIFGDLLAKQNKLGSTASAGDSGSGLG